MTDTLTSEQRSRNMRAIRGKDTKPEMKVRRFLHAQGYRYRLHKKGLPGKPDLTFPSRRKIILVNGCFWHGHECKVGRMPKSKQDYWIPKIQSNRDRDARNICALRNMGWKVFLVWECEIRHGEGLGDRLIGFLEG